MRSPLTRRDASIEALQKLWDELRTPTSAQRGSSGSGQNFGAWVYMNPIAIENGLVLSDALEERGYSNLARDLRNWSKQLIKHGKEIAKRLEMRGHHPELRSYVLESKAMGGSLPPYPSARKWWNIHARVGLALRELEQGRPKVLWYVDEDDVAWPVRLIHETRPGLGLYERLVPTARYHKRAELHHEQVIEDLGQIPIWHRKPRLARGAARFVRR